MNRNAIRALTVFGIGVALMLTLDTTWARIMGVACLVAGIGMSVFMIATPAFIDDADAESGD